MLHTRRLGAIFAPPPPWRSTSCRVGHLPRREPIANVLISTFAMAYDAGRSFEKSTPYNTIPMAGDAGGGAFPKATVGKAVKEQWFSCDICDEQ